MTRLKISEVTENAVMQEIRARGDYENVSFQRTCRKCGESTRF